MPKRICGLSKPANFSGGSPIPLQKLFWVTPVKPVDEAFKRFVDIEPVGCFHARGSRVSSFRTCRALRNSAEINQCIVQQLFLVGDPTNAALHSVLEQVVGPASRPPW